MLDVKPTGQGLTFNVYVQPRASKCAIVGIHQNALKIRLTAPPVKGAANKQCIEVLAKALGLAKSDLAITSGHGHRQKQVTVGNVSNPLNKAQKSDIRRKLEDLAQTSS
jgi:uncharacterized protein (TIGR00251 family)